MKHNRNSLFAARRACGVFRDGAILAGCTQVRIALIAARSEAASARAAHICTSLYKRTRYWHFGRLLLDNVSNMSNKPTEITPLPNHEPYDSWYTKQEAAAMLQIAEKTLDRMAGRGEIQKATRKRTGLPPQAIFHPGDIDRLKAAGDSPAPFVTIGTDVPAHHPTSAALIQVLTAIADRIAAPMEREPHFLTLKQAREVSGLPISYLRQHFVDAGRAIKTGGGWRISRAHLEQFAAATANKTTGPTVSNMSNMAATEGPTNGGYRGE